LQRNKFLYKQILINILFKQKHKKMIRKNMITKFAALTVVLTVAVTSCKKKDAAVEPTPTPVVAALKTNYTLKAKDVLGVTGTVSFAESSPGSTSSIVTITLTGAASGTHPAHIHMNSAVETGGVAYSLNSVNAAGSSVTTLSVSYAALINFDGYVNVHTDALPTSTIMAQGDIGGNVLTGTYKTYTLVQDSTSGVSGTARFDKRKNGNSLVTVDLTTGGVLPSGSYPAYINLGSVSTIGSPVIKKTLTAVDGVTRMSMTNVRTLDDATPITYDNWMVYDGFITINDAANNSNIIAKGNIGSN
jgi:Cu/Zn superoxide dismutase